jgi:hypothetical protein
MNVQTQNQTPISKPLKSAMRKRPAHTHIHSHLSPQKKVQISTNNEKSEKIKSTYYHFKNAGVYVFELQHRTHINLSNKPILNPINGKVRFIDTNKNIINGFYTNSVLHGPCKITCADKTTFEGQFENNMANGFGTITFFDKMSVHVQYIDNMAQGMCKWCLPDGNIYIGNIVDNYIEGAGLLFALADNKIYKQSYLKSQCMNSEPVSESEFKNLIFQYLFNTNILCSIDQLIKINEVVPYYKFLLNVDSIEPESNMSDDESEIEMGFRFEKENTRVSGLDRVQLYGIVESDSHKTIETNVDEW